MNFVRDEHSTLIHRSRWTSKTRNGLVFIPFTRNQSFQSNSGPTFVYFGSFFCVLGQGQHRRAAWNNLGKLERRATSGCIIDEREASMILGTVVDLEIRQELGQSRLKWTIHWKPSSLGGPLSHLSNHCPMMHKSLPTAEHRRTAERSSTHDDLIAAKRLLCRGSCSTT